LTDASGAFFSAEDADSPDPENSSHSGEGAFYIWRKSEIASLLGVPDAASFCASFGVQTEGNVDQDPHGEFTGRNILYRVSLGEDSDLAPAKQTLFQARSRRPRPHLDRKILTSWNGMMISALAKGFMVLGEEEYLRAAKRAASFLLRIMYDRPSGQLLRRYCDGQGDVPAFLDDYAMFATALLDLFEATSEPVHLEIAVDLARGAMKRFEDTEHGGFFSTRESAPDLLLRIKDDYDGAEPSGNSVMTELLLRLAYLTGDDAFRDSAGHSLRAFAPKLITQPTIAPQMLVALGLSLTEPEQIIVRCDEINAEIKALLAEYRRKFAPNSVALAITHATAASLEGIAPFVASLERKGRITIYECRSFTCQLPRVVG